MELPISAQVTIVRLPPAQVRIAMREGGGGVVSVVVFVVVLGTDQKVRLRLPRRINSLTARDQSSIGRLVAEHLGISLRAS